MWEELEALGLLKAEQREDIYLLKTLRDFKLKLEEKLRGKLPEKEIEFINTLIGRIGELHKAVESDFKKAKIEELAVKSVGKVKVQILKKLLKQDEFSRLGEERIAIALLKALRDDRLKPLLDAPLGHEVTNLYRFLLDFRRQLSKRTAKKELIIKAVEKELEKKIRAFFLESPAQVNIIGNLLLAHGGEFEYGLASGPSGGIPQRYPRTIYLKEKKTGFYIKKEIKNLNEEKTYFALGEPLVKLGIVVYNSTARARSRHAAVH